MRIIDKLQALSGRLENITPIANNECREVFERNADDCVYQVQTQLLEGKSGKGTDLTPKYADDTYFQSTAHMERYLTWKKNVYGVDVPSNGSPNLIINGRFHGSLFLNVTETGCSMESDVEFAEEIWTKYGKENFFINNSFFKNEIKPQIVAGIAKQIKGGAV